MLIPTSNLTLLERLTGCNRIPVTIEDCMVMDIYDSKVLYMRHEYKYTNEVFDTQKRPKAVKRCDRLRRLIRKNKLTIYPDHFILIK